MEKINWKEIADLNNMNVKELGQELIAASVSYMLLEMLSNDSVEAVVAFPNVVVTYTLTDTNPYFTVH